MTHHPRILQLEGVAHAILIQQVCRLIAFRRVGVSGCFLGAHDNRFSRLLGVNPLLSLSRGDNIICRQNQKQERINCNATA
jgi:hypothetical protein